MAGVLLHAPQDFRNLCAIARTLEVLGHRDVNVFDPWGLIRDRYGKARSRVMRDVSGGAFEKLRWNRVPDASSFLRTYRGRVVATVADSGATQLSDFSFRTDDLVVFGGESQGLPPEIVALAAAAVTIASAGETQSLNLSVAVGIVVFEAVRQLSRG
jgi:tRNA (cytidine/uridine-2'-O-)-methyltransferase